MLDTGPLFPTAARIVDSDSFVQPIPRSNSISWAEGRTYYKDARWSAQAILIVMDRYGVDIQGKSVSMSGVVENRVSRVGETSTILLMLVVSPREVQSVR